MKILLYVPFLNQSGGGAKQYSIALLKTLSKDNSNYYYILNYDNNSEIRKICDESRHFSLIPKWISKEYMLERFILSSIKFINLIFNVLQLKLRPFNFSFLSRICFFYNIDIVHCPYQYAPYSNAKTIWTLHDVQELHYPQYFTPLQREQRARTWNDNFKRANHVIVSFKHVANDIKTFFSIDDVSTVFIDLKFIWISDIISKYGRYVDLSSNYLIYAANTWQHKNHSGLIQAVKYIKNKYDQEIQVVFVGHQTEYFEKLNFEIQSLGLKNQIIFKGVVTELELYNLYKNARLSVIPSIYEAGSFPLIESLLLGIPTLCSSVTSLPETIGNDSFVFDPFDINEMGELIFKTFNDGEFRNRCLNNSLSQGQLLLQSENLSSFKIVYQKLVNYK